jgi:uncharacterized SAM-binding protein YcdF (DUF218 family)
LARRIAHAIAVYRQGRVGSLLLSGGVVRHPPAEAALMRLAALAAGVPEDALAIEDRSRNTLENAQYCAPIIARRGWRRVLLITDSYHLPRSLYTFRRFGVAADGDPVPPPRRDGALLAAQVREMAAFLVYLWRVERALRP